MNIDQLCPIEDFSNNFNRKWMLCILMDMFRGLNRFSQFQESNPALNNYTLSQTLKYMEESKLIKKTINDNIKEYHLTDKGLKLNKVLYEITVFSLEELDLSRYNEKVKNKILTNYKKALNI